MSRELKAFFFLIRSVLLVCVDHSLLSAAQRSYFENMYFPKSPFRWCGSPSGCPGLWEDAQKYIPSEVRLHAYELPFFSASAFTATSSFPCFFCLQHFSFQKLLSLGHVVRITGQLCKIH